MASMKLNTVKWQGKNDLYDLGIVYKHQYKLEVHAMQEIWFQRYLQEESKWKAHIQNLKAQNDQLRKEKEIVYDLPSKVINCRPPSPVYSIYLHEKWVTFQLARIRL